jgi:hypothetical protein
VLEHAFDRVPGVETKEHWWNGLWGTATRRDIWLRLNHGGPLWEIEVRYAGRSTLREFRTERAARLVLRELTAGGPGEWRQLQVPAVPYR